MNGASVQSINIAWFDCLTNLSCLFICVFTYTNIHTKLSLDLKALVSTNKNTTTRTSKVQSASIISRPTAVALKLSSSKFEWRNLGS